MKLNQILQQTRESRVAFFDRCYYVGDMGNPRIFVYESLQALHDPTAKAVKVMTVDEARRYIQELEPGIGEREIGEDEMGEINWDDMSGNFVKLENAKPKRLKLNEWRQQEQFKFTEGTKTGQLRFGLTFDVIEEDGTAQAKVDGKAKEWTVTAIKACAKLKPIIQKAEAAGKKEIMISVLRAGEGKQTVYEIEEVIDYDD